MKYLIDSNIIIYLSHQNQAAKSFIQEHRASCALSLVTYYEVLNYDLSPQASAKLRAFLEMFEIIGISKDIVVQALENRKIKKTKMADNFILATAQLHHLKIVTNNEKDFQYFVETYNPIHEQ